MFEKQSLEKLINRQEKRYKMEVDRTHNGMDNYLCDKMIVFFKWSVMIARIFS